MKTRYKEQSEKREIKVIQDERERITMKFQIKELQEKLAA